MNQDGEIILVYLGLPSIILKGLLCGNGRKEKGKGESVLLTGWRAKDSQRFSFGPRSFSLSVNWVTVIYLLSQCSKLGSSVLYCAITNDEMAR